MNTSEKIIGIDLGTTNSVLAVIQNGVPTLLPINGQRLLPSLVGISPAGEVLVGTPARNQWVVAPDRTVRSIKRKMGRGELVTMAGKSYTPQEISAFILREIKQGAEAALGYPVRRAVITVPAYFTEVQRQATIEAGEIAGLAVERIINEPTASALAYGYGLDTDQHLRMLVYDLGGGTFDISIIELNYGVVEVLATAGDNFLGGDDFDERLANMLADEFMEAHDIDLRQDHQAWARLLRVAEETKIELSAAPFATANLEFIARDLQHKPLHIIREVSRYEFEALIGDLLDRTITCIDQALGDAKLTAADIDRVLLVGGSTRIPAVWDLVSVRLEREPHLEIDPDAAVALGAAVQAGIIAGEDINAILVDVTPFSLGIEAAEFGITGHLQIDMFIPIIRRNNTVPVQKSQLFVTMFPSQDKIQIKVYQGESPIASQNVLLGEFMAEELQPNRPDGLTEVTVNFQLDINGILDATVTERKTGKKTSAQLKASRQRLSLEEIAQSQAKLDVVYGDSRGEMEFSPLDDMVQIVDPGVAVLLDRAQKTLARPDLDGEMAAEIAGVVMDIHRATADSNNEKIEEYCDRLIDLLLEVE
ncbi:MAG: heat-shock protein Hsp70 [Chloroflexi bacterium]|nr:heat-shock protein Hsp70 [Chloroflexota bacterium]